MEASLKETFPHLEEVPTVKSKVSQSTNDFDVELILQIGYDLQDAARSLRDDVVVYASPSLTYKSGYYPTAEVRSGRLLDFAHPTNLPTFTNNQITPKLLTSSDKDDSSSSGYLMGYSFNSGK